MKIIFYTLFLLLSIHAVAQHHLITGMIKDAETRQALPFCSIGILKTKTGGNSDSYGKFKLEIPAELNNPELIITCIGYKTDTLKIFSAKNEYLILLKPLPEKLNEVVVTGVSKATLIRENPIPVINVSVKNIDRANESNIIDALVKNVPGLNAVKTGPNISKPFIRGLGYNRVLTLYDGIRQEGQQWGDEHGIEVDAYNMQRAEVIKGPASLQYGSDALAGVVSLIPYIPNEKDSVWRGRFLSEYQGNNGLVGNGLRLGYSNVHWLFAVRGNYRIARNYTNSIDGKVYNTGFEEKNASALIGYTSEKGYTHLNVTAYDDLQGIPDGSRDSLTRKFTKQIYEGTNDNVKSRPVVSDAALNSYKLSPLHQHIQHYRVYTNNHYQIGKGDLDGVLGFQQNIRREYDHPTDPKQAGMYVRLNTINYGLRYNAPVFFNIEVSVGINGMYQNNKNKSATDFPVPDYKLMDAGAYLYAKWKYRNWTVSGGIRYDVRNLSGDNFYISNNATNGFNYESGSDVAGAVLQFPAFKKTFSGVSSSIGSTYQVSDEISLKANVARGYRAPSITEFASNGLDPGAHIVYLGNRNFVPEFSLQEDMGVSGVFKDISASVSLFNNNIQHYIYLSQSVDENGRPIVVSQGNKTFQYQQASAQLYGLEAAFDLHPGFIKGFDFNNNFSLVYGFNRKQQYIVEGINGEYLPLIPPMKLLSTISYDIKTNLEKLPTVSIKAEMDYNASQNRYLALYRTETPTPGYALFNAGISAEIRYTKKQTLQLQLQVNNIFDLAYQSNLSRLKYFEYYNQSADGRYGMYSMGRNSCVKLILPF
ncbi:MAG: putative tonB-linked outer rane receptor [Bacteroidetes bacterium]|nr:putative tonB-linked outer rane receptor [Bacteroidota bacterium]